MEQVCALNAWRLLASKAKNLDKIEILQLPHYMCQKK